MLNSSFVVDDRCSNDDGNRGLVRYSQELPTKPDVRVEYFYNQPCLASNQNINEPSRDQSHVTTTASCDNFRSLYPTNYSSEVITQISNTERDVTSELCANLYGDNVPLRKSTDTTSQSNYAAVDSHTSFRMVPRQQRRIEILPNTTNTVTNVRYDTYDGIIERRTKLNDANSMQNYVVPPQTNYANFSDFTANQNSSQKPCLLLQNYSNSGDRKSFELCDSKRRCNDNKPKRSYSEDTFATKPHHLNDDRLIHVQTNFNKNVPMAGTVSSLDAKQRSGSYFENSLPQSAELKRISTWDTLVHSIDNVNKATISFNDDYMSKDFEESNKQFDNQFKTGNGQEMDAWKCSVDQQPTQDIAFLHKEKRRVLVRSNSSDSSDTIVLRNNETVIKNSGVFSNGAHDVMDYNNQQVTSTVFYNLDSNNSAISNDIPPPIPPKLTSSKCLILRNNASPAEPTQVSTNSQIIKSQSSNFCYANPQKSSKDYFNHPRRCIYQVDKPPNTNNHINNSRHSFDNQTLSANTEHSMLTSQHRYSMMDSINSNPLSWETYNDVIPPQLPPKRGSVKQQTPITHHSNYDTLSQSLNTSSNDSGLFSRDSMARGSNISMASTSNYSVIRHKGRDHDISMIENCQLSSSVMSNTSSIGHSFRPNNASSLHGLNHAQNNKTASSNHQTTIKSPFTNNNASNLNPQLQQPSRQSSKSPPKKHPASSEVSIQPSIANKLSTPKIPSNRKMSTPNNHFIQHNTSNSNQSFDSCHRKYSVTTIGNSQNHSDSATNGVLNNISLNFLLPTTNVRVRKTSNSILSHTDSGIMMNEDQMPLQTSAIFDMRDVLHYANLYDKSYSHFDKQVAHIDRQLVQLFNLCRNERLLVDLQCSLFSRLLFWVCHILTLPGDTLDIVGTEDEGILGECLNEELEANTEQATNEKCDAVDNDRFSENLEAKINLLFAQKFQIRNENKAQIDSLISDLQNRVKKVRDTVVQKCLQVDSRKFDRTLEGINLLVKLVCQLSRGLISNVHSMKQDQQNSKVSAHGRCLKSLQEALTTRKTITTRQLSLYRTLRDTLTQSELNNFVLIIRDTWSLSVCSKVLENCRTCDEELLRLINEHILISANHCDEANVLNNHSCVVEAIHAAI